MQKESEVLLKRTNLELSLDKILTQVGADYPAIGRIQNCQPILQGYEDANFILKTTNGDYVLKLFSKDRPKANIDDYTKVLEVAEEIGFPTARLVEGKQGVLSQIPGEKPAFYNLTHFFDGANFEHQTPSLDDCQTVAEYLARLNTLDFPVTESYDSWGNKNLIREFAENAHLLSSEVRLRVERVVEQLKQLSWDNFSQSVIHGDLQRKHVLKSKAGEYCILDFGCMSHAPKIIELSTYLGWFCLQPDTWNNQAEITAEVIDTYTQTHKLTNEEHEALRPLIAATYAAYYMKTHLLITEGDTSQETKDWHDTAETMLTRFSQEN